MTSDTQRLNEISLPRWISYTRLLIAFLFQKIFLKFLCLIVGNYLNNGTIVMICRWYYYCLKFRNEKYFESAISDISRIIQIIASSLKNKFRTINNMGSLEQFSSTHGKWLPRFDRVWNKSPPLNQAPPRRSIFATIDNRNSLIRRQLIDPLENYRRCCSRKSGSAVAA